MQDISAGILTLKDIIYVNKKTEIEEVRSFFQVMEVYGHSADMWVNRVEVANDNSEMSDFQEQDKLELLRRKSLNQLSKIT